MCVRQRQTWINELLARLVNFIRGLYLVSIVPSNEPLWDETPSPPPCWLSLPSINLFRAALRPLQRPPIFFHNLWGLINTERSNLHEKMVQWKPQRRAHQREPAPLYCKRYHSPNEYNLIHNVKSPHPTVTGQGPEANTLLKQFYSTHPVSCLRPQPYIKLYQTLIILKNNEVPHRVAARAELSVWASWQEDPTEIILSLTY